MSIAFLDIAARFVQDLAHLARHVARQALLVLRHEAPRSGTGSRRAAVPGWRARPGTRGTRRRWRPPHPTASDAAKWPTTSRSSAGLRDSNVAPCAAGHHSPSMKLPVVGASVVWLMRRCYRPASADGRAPRTRRAPGRRRAPSSAPRRRPGDAAAPARIGGAGGRPGSSPSASRHSSAVSSRAAMAQASRSHDGRVDTSTRTSPAGPPLEQPAVGRRRRSTARLSLGGPSDPDGRVSPGTADQQRPSVGGLRVAGRDEAGGRPAPSRSRTPGRCPRSARRGRAGSAVSVPGEQRGPPERAPAQVRAGGHASGRPATAPRP